LNTGVLLQQPSNLIIEQVQFRADSVASHIFGNALKILTTLIFIMMYSLTHLLTR